MPLHFISKLRGLFYIPQSTLFYGILKPCYRCTYQRGNEPILIFSKDRGPRIIMHSKDVFVMEGKCVGYENCGLCFEQVCIQEDTLPCKWKKLYSVK